MSKEKAEDSKTFYSLCTLLLLFILICLALTGLIILWTRNEENRQFWKRWTSSLGLRWWNQDVNDCRAPDCTETCIIAPNYKTTLAENFNISQSRLKIDFTLTSAMPFKIELYSTDHKIYVQLDLNPTNQDITLADWTGARVTVNNVTCLDSNRNITIYIAPINNQNNTLQGYHFEIEPLQQPFKRQDLGQLNATYSSDHQKLLLSNMTYKLDVADRVKFLSYCIQTPKRK
uniref:Uncharacterized protein n=1 Tax=Romanomermis culicivorax TaxID=13658 RepID=A0A915L121_ROMCU